MVENVGSTSLVLGLIALATDVEALYAGVKALTCVVKTNRAGEMGTRPKCHSHWRVLGPLRSSYTTRTKCAISDAFVRDCVFAYCASVVQYVYSLSAEHCFRLRKNAITDERVRDCALSTHSVFRPLESLKSQSVSDSVVGILLGGGHGVRMPNSVLYVT